MNSPKNQISNMFLTNIQQIYAKWRCLCGIFVQKNLNLTLTSHLSLPEGKIRARCTQDQPNQCLMNIFGRHCAPYDESHQGKRYNLKTPHRRRNFLPSLRASATHLKFLILLRNSIDWWRHSLRSPFDRVLLNWFWTLAISSLSGKWDESLKALNNLVP